MVRFGARFGWIMRAAAGMSLAVLLSACAEDRIAVRSAPMVAGNTFDRHNALEIIYPDSERINLSYEFVRSGDTQDLEAAGLYGGPAWLFVDRQPAIPERFVFIHLAKGVDGYEIPRGELIRLGQRRFFVFSYCLADWRTGETPPQILQYLEALEGEGFALSDDLYVRQFMSRNADSENRRTDVVFVRDIMRSGYDCERIGDVDEPETDGKKELINSLEKDAAGSFEVMG